MNSHDPKFLDNLLDDLENVVNSTSTSYRYIPRPPPELPIMMNPKIKFAIVPSSTSSATSSLSSSSLSSSSYSTPSTTTVNYNSSEKRYDSKQQQQYQNQNQQSKNNPNDSSIDSLLEMLNSPERKSTPSTTGYQTNSTSNYSTPQQSKYQQSSYSSNLSSTSSSSAAKTPVVTPNHSKPPSSNYNSPPSSYKSSSQQQGLDTSFDDLLSGLESPPPTSKPYTSSYSSTNSSQSRPNASTESSRGPSSSSSSSSSSSNVNLISSSASSSSTTDSGKSRCSRVVLAGSAMTRGIKTSAFSKCACDRLRCLQCNFEILQFRDQQWDSSVEYMFFRNNVPNAEKLSVSLVSSEGFVAYCCQCSWKSVDSEITLSPGISNQPQWMCSGH